jgi:hypothetical protein
VGVLDYRVENRPIIGDFRMSIRTEKEKMLAGELYLSADPQIV